MDVLGRYINGNYECIIYDDGTKEKITNDDIFIPNFPDSIDLKITNYCDLGCKMCHEASTTKGLHASFDYSFIDTLNPYTELAIGGGNPLAHPNLIPFLKRLKNKNIIANITINEAHLYKYMDLILYLIDNKLIYGLGISISRYFKRTIEFAKNNKNVVLHAIIGITDFDKLFNLDIRDTKILLLGYKKYGRGLNYYNEEIDNNIYYVKSIINKIFNRFLVVGFDNLALIQLDIKNILDNDLYNNFYMGDDGISSMYIDLVNNKFAKSSTSNIRYEILDNIKDMLNIIHKEVGLK